MKKISIVIPSYNASNYILKNLEVICQDKYKDKLEVIVVDDGSTDETEKIVKKYIKEKQFVKYYKQKNAGAPVARNNGLNHSHGDYVIFLDADDVLIEESIDKIFKLIEMEDYDLIMGNFDIIDEKDNYLKSTNEVESEGLIKTNNIFNHIVNDPKPGSKVYNIKLIKEKNIIFDDLNIGQDLNFFIKYLLFAKKIYTLKEPIYKYRVVEGSISRTYTTKILKIKDSFDAIKEFYKKNNSIDIYNEYVQIAKMSRYYSQFCKIRFINNKKERKEVYYFFKNEFKKLKIDKTSNLFEKEKKTYYKFKFKIFIGKIYTTNIYCSTYKKIYGNHHNT